MGCVETIAKNQWCGGCKNCGAVPISDEKEAGQLENRREEKAMEVCQILVVKDKLSGECKNVERQC